MHREFIAIFLPHEHHESWSVSNNQIAVYIQLFQIAGATLLP